jgi:hypothetical protein
MSFGYGFSLPALTTFGGGGNNPFGQLGPTLDLSFAGTVTDPSNPNGYTLDTNFITPQYQIAADYTIWETNVGLVSKTFSEIITFTRASTGSFFNSAGVLSSAATDAPRFDYNPSTLAAQGLLIEESRANSIRNNTMVGAVAGTPGTLPTNWPVGAPSGLTQTVVGTGTESGITYIDIRINGTTTSALFYGISAENTNSVAALPNSVWASTFYVRLVGGSLTNITGVKHVITNFNAVGAALNEFAISSITPTSAALSTQRYAVSTTSATFANALTAFARGFLQVEANTGVAVDITLRIGLPQFELGAFATSVIPTTTTALTRAADVASVNTLSPWYNATEGTLYAEVVYLGQLIGTATETNTIQLSDGTAANRITLRTVRDPTSPQLDVNVATGGVLQMDSAGFQPGVVGTTYKRAIGYALNNAQPCNNGTLDGATDTSFAVPTGINVFAFPTSACALYARRVTYYPRRLSNAELQTLTT